MRVAEANGWSQTAARTARNETEATETKREVVTGSAGGRWPNETVEKVYT
jgi:hypothetical protein